jgi:hypothetical protein
MLKKVSTSREISLIVLWVYLITRNTSPLVLSTVISFSIVEVNFSKFNGSGT